MPDAAVEYLSPQTLAAVGSLELRARMIVEGLMTGMHRSPYLGFSVEFAQHRPYAPGDDLRRLDWKVFARTDKLYLKQYQKETNLDLVMLMDTSGSMAFSSVAGTHPWRKYDHAASVAAALGYLALSQQDRVGLVLFDQEVRTATRMSSARDHWRSLVEALDAAAPRDQTSDRGTDLARLFDQVTAKLTQRSLIVLLSDLFEDPEALERGLARLSFHRHDLILLQVMDPAELTFPYRGAAEFLGLEGEGRLRLDPAALRDAYLETLDRHQTAVEQIARRFRFDHLLLDSSQSLAAPLSRFLARRAAGEGAGHR